MPSTHVMHSQSWTMEISPAEGDDWPAVQAYATGPMVKIDHIHVYLTAGHRTYDLKAFGPRLKKDGTPGQGRSQVHFYSTSGIPDWITEIIEHERQATGLGEGTVCPSAP